MKVFVLSILLVSVGSYGVDSYSQVSTSGSGTANGPKVYKALNMDLIFPKTFNSSENVISTTQTSAPEPMTVAVESLSSTAGEQFTPEYSSSQLSADPPPIPANHYPPAFVIPDNHAEESEEYGATLPPPATGRAVDYRPAYPFSQLLTPNSKGYRPSAEQYPLRSRPVVSSPSSAHRVVYPSYQASRTPSRAEIDKLSGKGQFPDRSIPIDAVVSMLSQSHPTGQQPNQAKSNVPSKDSLPSKAYYGKSFYHDNHRSMASSSYENDVLERFRDNGVINIGRAFNLPASSKLSLLLEAFSEARAAEARVKNYSYFYIAQALWYGPLYFSVYFSFYILWLITKSISLHASKLPSQYKDGVVRSFGDIPQREVRQIIDNLSLTVMVGKFSDRFTPSEAVASNSFKQTQNHNHNHKPSISRPIGQSSKKVTSFVPTKDLYSFPPNVNARYPSPLDTKQASPSDTITSYLPPAAGPLSPGKLVGPVNPDLLPNSMKNGEIAKDASGGGYHYDPPQPPLDADLGANIDGGDDQGGPPDDDIGVMPAPADDDDGANDSPPPPPPSPPSPPADFVHDHDHHGHDYPVGGYADDKEYPTPPPGYLEEHDHDHHHDYEHDEPDPHHHHHTDIDFSQGPYLDDPHHHHDHFSDHHYPDVIYDDYHDHHFHHDHIIEHHPEPTTEPPPPPPPPAPEQPRVKKYSYFYIGRKLWYIPLYFTLWFTFYILWLILKSIARHKVNLPDHYVSRRSIDDLNHRGAREAIDNLTIRVMDGIEKFQQRFIG